MTSSNQPKPRNTIYSSDGFSVRLTDAEYKFYKEEERRFQLRWMKIEYQTRGIWASNQNKYVQSIEELNDFDRKPDPEVIK